MLGCVYCVVNIGIRYYFSIGTSKFETFFSFFACRVDLYEQTYVQVRVRVREKIHDVTDMSQSHENILLLHVKLEKAPVCMKGSKWELSMVRMKGSKWELLMACMKGSKWELSLACRKISKWEV